MDEIPYSMLWNSNFCLFCLNWILYIQEDLFAMKQTAINLAWAIAFREQHHKGGNNNILSDVYKLIRTGWIQSRKVFLNKNHGSEDPCLLLTKIIL